MRTLAAVVIIALAFSACGGGPPQPGESAFLAANTQLTNNNKQFVFGNGGVAERLATSFNLRMKLMLKLAFKSRVPGSSLDDDFITHVHLADDTVIFLVYVPGLRNFKEDAQGTLLDVAWTMARGRIENLEPARDRKLAVALRGLALYGAAAFGPASAEKPDTKTNTGIVRVEDLYPFFTGTYPQEATYTDGSATTPAPATTEAAAPPAEAAPATVIEAADSGDRIAASLATHDMNAGSTVIAIAPDLFVASMAMPFSQGGLKPARASMITVRNVGNLPGTDLVLYRPVESLKFPAIPLAPGGAPAAGTTVTTYLARASGTTYTEVSRFTSKVTSTDGGIHTDQRLDFIPQGAALVDDQGRLLGIATGSANVYATAADIRRLIEAARAKSAQ
jgi:hypothetical protein